MNCLKCGRETPAEQVFCEDCLLDMKKYPVRPGTVVHLPNRKDLPAAKKQPRKRAVPLEDQVKLLKKRSRNLSFALLVAIVIVLALAHPAIQHLMEDHFAIGQNYSSVTSTTEASQPN